MIWGALALLGGAVLISSSATASNNVNDDINANSPNKYPNPGAASRGLRNNNPGNIRKSSAVTFAGELQPSGDTAFKQFKTMAYGYRAMFKLLSTYYNAYGLDTISKMINRWAPPSDGNDTAGYIASINNWTGLNTNVHLNINSKNVMTAIVSAMSRMENGFAANATDVLAGWDLYINNISGTGYYNEPDEAIYQLQRLRIAA